ncbi:hypothetical protein AXG93_1838s1350 [Marchantia polymorpha subsp. ruderalis]|uniref:Uncharacterized protein n=1 Tax=Marchantia polymorpha subsp. ruderalis TaxID=1480154 RepID=A0A176WHP8_MARPO|nr:hypothetical protein AXG93_1838s1350 [Marchantia polymorpha subsp. ruderalis]
MTLAPRAMRNLQLYRNKQEVKAQHQSGYRHSHDERIELQTSTVLLRVPRLHLHPRKGKRACGEIYLLPLAALGLQMMPSVYPHAITLMLLFCVLNLDVFSHCYCLPTDTDLPAANEQQATIDGYRCLTAKRKLLVIAIYESTTSNLLGMTDLSLEQGSKEGHPSIDRMASIESLVASGVAWRNASGLGYSLACLLEYQKVICHIPRRDDKVVSFASPGDNKVLANV